MTQTAPAELVAADLCGLDLPSSRIQAATRTGPLSPTSQI